MTNNASYLNFSFSFRFCGVRFKVDIDESFSAKQKYKDAKPGNLEHPLHYHTKEELFFVFDEPLSVESEGEGYEFKNTAVLIPPFLKHRSARKGDFRLLYSYEIIENTDFARFFQELSERKTISSVGSIKSSLLAYLDDLLEMITSKDGPMTEAAESILKILFYRLFSASGGTSKKGTRKESYLLTVERIINTNSIDPESEVSLELISKELNLCKKQVSRIIKEHYGKPLFALVLEKKMTVACELLTETNLSVSEIARHANFESENYFFKKFKAAFGTTPLKYRKTHGK